MEYQFIILGVTLYDMKIKSTRDNKTTQQKLPTRLIAHQSASAHATLRIKVNGVKGRMRSVISH